MATKNHTITKGLFIYFIRDKLFEVCGLFCLLTFEEKQRKGEEENRWPNLTPEVLFMKQCLDSNCLFQPPRQTLLSLLCFSLSL